MYIYIHARAYTYTTARYTYCVGIGIFHSEGLVVVAYKPSTVNLVVELFMRSISNANVQQCHASFGCNFVI